LGQTISARLPLASYRDAQLFVGRSLFVFHMFDSSPPLGVPPPGVAIAFRRSSERDESLAADESQRKQHRTETVNRDPTTVVGQARCLALVALIVREELEKLAPQDEECGGLLKELKDLGLLHNLISTTLKNMGFEGFLDTGVSEALRAATEICTQGAPNANEFTCWSDKPTSTINDVPDPPDAVQGQQDDAVDTWTVELLTQCHDDVISEADAASMRQSKVKRINPQDDGGVHVTFFVDRGEDIFFNIHQRGHLVHPALDTIAKAKMHFRSKLRRASNLNSNSFVFSAEDQGLSFYHPFSLAGLVKNGPRVMQPVTARCGVPPSKGTTLVIGGETGSGKTTWSAFVLPGMVGAANGLLYHSCRHTGLQPQQHSLEAKFEAVEEADAKIVEDHSDLLDALGIVVWERVKPLGGKCIQAYRHLRDAILERIDFSRRDTLALNALYALASRLLNGVCNKKFGGSIPASITNIIFGLTMLANNVCSGAFDDCKLTQPARLVMVIDEAGRCPGFVRSIVTQCRAVYHAFEHFFNIQLVIAFCGTGTELYAQKTGIFREGTDPSRVLRLKIVAGPQNGLEFAKMMYAAGKTCYNELPKEFSAVDKLPLSAQDQWSNARLTVTFLTAFLETGHMLHHDTMEMICHCNLASAYEMFLRLNGLTTYPVDMKRTLINVAYWTIIRNTEEPDTRYALLEPKRELLMTSTLEDGLCLITDAPPDGVEDSRVADPTTKMKTTRKEHLLLPGQVKDAQKAELKTLQEMCVSVGLLSLDPLTDQLTASDALRGAIACGFRVPEIRKADGFALEELVSIAAKRTAEVGGFAATIVRLKDPFPGPMTTETGGQDVIVDFDAMGAIVTALQKQVGGGREKYATYVGTAVIVVNGPHAPFADVIKICRVHGTHPGARTSVTFYDVKHEQGTSVNSIGDMESLARTAACECELNGVANAADATRDSEATIEWKTQSEPKPSMIFESDLPMLRSSFARAAWMEVAAAQDAASLCSRFEAMSTPGYVEPPVVVRMVLQDSLDGESLPGPKATDEMPRCTSPVAVRRQHLRHLGLFARHVNLEEKKMTTLLAVGEHTCPKCLVTRYLYPNIADYKCVDCLSGDDADGN
jgi:hypothetical protein